MGDLKAQMATLKAEYQELRDRFLSGEFGADGHEYYASTCYADRRSIPVERAKGILSPELFEQVTVSGSQTNVSVKKRVNC